jgi:Flp pilus assembly protein TadG
MCLFQADRRANVAVMFALSMLPVIGAMGLAIDGGRAYLIHTRMAKALDAAGLAAARVALSDRAAADARRFFDANFPDGYLGSTIVDFTYKIDDNKDFVTVSARADLPTVLMQLFGFDRLDVSDAAVIERLNRGLEVALVLDVTGSMSNTEMQWLRESSSNLVDILFGDSEELDLLWISVVPYTATVNIGAHRTNWLKPFDRARAHPEDFGPDPWKGCVMARSLDRDTTADPPSIAAFESFFYEDAVDNHWELPDGEYAVNTKRSDGNNMRGPNLGCGPAISELTNFRSSVQGSIDELESWSRGGTSSNLGMVWGWRTISPQWRGEWGGATPADMPLDKDEPLMDKVAVLMTDGENQFYDWPRSYVYEDGRLKTVGGGNGPDGSDFTAFGRLDDLEDSAFGSAQEILNEKTVEICEAMKAEGIIIFTVTFGVSNNSIQDLFRNCATEPGNYFNTTSASKTELYDAFSAIGQRLSNLRVVE